jgi:phosphatidylglycerol:prolipoprotein diacylglycerol transferase
MIDPVIFTIKLGDFQLAFRWYGVLIMIGVLVGAWVAEKELVRRGGNSDHIWDGLIWVLPAAIIGARVWYVLNDIVGGGRSYIDQPGRIFRITEGGLHIFGAIVFGVVAAYLYGKRHKVDLLLMLDSAAPALLIGQALARPANFINQELYGPPTSLPWGIPIDEAHRLSPWKDLNLYPLETTRFHPTFAYEMIWNLIAAGIILWLVRKYAEKVKPGTAFACWLLLAGIGRVFIETFRPDQPLIPGTALSYSRLIAGLMTVAGLFWLLIRYEIIKLTFLSPGPEEYWIPKRKKSKRK